MVSILDPFYMTGGASTKDWIDAIGGNSVLAYEPKFTQDSELSPCAPFITKSEEMKNER